MTGGRLQTGFAVLIMFLATACSLRRDRDIHVPTTIPDHFQAARGPVAGPPPERWWETFDDPKLNKLVLEVFAQSPNIAVAFARLDQSNAILKTTTSLGAPRIGVEARGSYEEAPGITGDSSGVAYRLAASASYEIDLWRKLSSQTRAGILDREASRRDAATLFMSLAARTADLYFFAVEQREQLRLTREIVESFSDTLQVVERRYRQGFVTALDVYQARQNLAAAKAARPLIEARIATIDHGLSVLLGRYPGATRIPSAPVNNFAWF